MSAKALSTHPRPRLPFATSVPHTEAERQAAADRWERRGLLARLVRRAA
jgi:hypothetical protein